MELKKKACENIMVYCATSDKHLFQWLWSWQNVSKKIVISNSKYKYNIKIKHKIYSLYYWYFLLALKDKCNITKNSSKTLQLLSPHLPRVLVFNFLHRTKISTFHSYIQCHIHCATNFSTAFSRHQVSLGFLARRGGTEKNCNPDQSRFIDVSGPPGHNALRETRYATRGDVTLLGSRSFVIFDSRIAQYTSKSLEFLRRWPAGFSALGLPIVSPMENSGRLLQKRIWPNPCATS